MVYVINYDNQPLMPCSNVIARLLLKQGKVKVKRIQARKSWLVTLDFIR